MAYLSIFLLSEHLSCIIVYIATAIAGYHTRILMTLTPRLTESSNPFPVKIRKCRILCVCIADGVFLEDIQPSQPLSHRECFNRKDLDFPSILPSTYLSFTIP